MFACPRPSDSTFTSKLVPLALLACPLVLAVSFGLNGRLWQPATWNGEETGALAPWSPLSVPSIAHRVAVGGVELEAGAVDAHVDLFELQGDPGRVRATP